MLTGAAHDDTDDYCPGIFHRGTLRASRCYYPTEEAKRSPALPLREGREAAAYSEGKGKAHPYGTARAAANHGQGQNSAEHYRKTKLEVEIS